MAIKFIVNEADRDRVKIGTTTAAGVDVDDRDKILNVTGGARHLEWTQVDSTTREISYIAKWATGLTADTVVLARADRHIGHDLTIKSYSAYPASPTTVGSVTTLGSGSLVGPDSQDYILEFTEKANQQAFGVEFGNGAGGAYTRIVNSLFFGSAFSFQNVESITRRPVPKRVPLDVGRNTYYVQEQISMTFSAVAEDQLQDFEELYRAFDEPCFIYDSLGSFITEKLLHIIITARPVVKYIPAQDVNTIKIDFSVLRYY